jgi:hypothetical protein
MYATLATLVDRLDSAAVSGTNVIRWGCPVPSFGDLSNSLVATLGLNPSNREFVDESGHELQGSLRRFHTLKSLGIRSWADVDARHLRLILESCRSYFLGNPYDRWFKRLDQVISGTQASYYGVALRACHLDLIPYATASKWTELTSRQRSSLLVVAGDTLGLLLRDSPVRLLILNGRSVVEQFEEVADISLERCNMPSWALPRRSGIDVGGIAYKGVVDTLSGIGLRHRVVVLGFNHNLQSSFGVTTQVLYAIRKWITRMASEVIP